MWCVCAQVQYGRLLRGSPVVRYGALVCSVDMIYYLATPPLSPVLMSAMAYVTHVRFSHMTLLCYKSATAMLAVPSEYTVGDNASVLEAYEQEASI